MGLIAIGTGIVGLVLGSFANVPIHRWPRGGTVSAPARSVCGSCEEPIRPLDNIPVVSWLVLRGRCRRCGAPIAVRYLAVEIAIGASFATTAAVHGLVWELPALLALFWVLVVGAVIDLEHRIIPNRLTYRAAPVLLLLLMAPAIASDQWIDMRRAVVAGVAIPGAMLAMSELFRLIRGQAGIGMGDIKLAVSIGLVVGYLGGWELVVWFYATAISAVVVAFGLVAAGRAKLATRIPYGPYLAFGAIVAVLAGEPLGSWMERFLGLA